MKTLFTKLSIVLFLATITSSCGFDMINRIDGDRNVVSKNRKINDDFTKLKASSGLDVYIKQGSKTSITVEADENLHDIIYTEVEGGTLKIYTDRNIWRAKAKKVYVTISDDIEEIKATSGSDLYSEGTIKAEDLELSTSSGAYMKIEIDAKNVTTRSSSGADLRVFGKANSHYSSASSGSSIRAYELESKDVEVKVSSGADISIYASESIDAKASSGGDIRYKGNPEKVDKKSSSGGSVRSRS